MNFVDSIKKETNITYTENGMEAYKTTNSDLLDLFGIIGSLRARNRIEIEKKFANAFAEDNLLAMKMLFYARNIRGGLGERRTFRIIINYMAKYHTEIMRKNIDLIPVFGRWDDLYSLVGTPLEDDVFEMIGEQLAKDMRNMMTEKEVSLCAKWLYMPTKASNLKAKLGRLTARKLNITYKEYRKALSNLRRYIKVVEVKMSENNWDEINYSQVPSLAMKKYRKAFARHSPELFDNYVKKVQNGEEKINSSTLYPYDLMLTAGLQIGWGDVSDLTNWDEVIEEQWKALPNYIEGENNILVMADTSGSMAGRPMASSVGLAVYFAERNKGIFHNTFMTFSETPELVTIKGNTLKEKVRNIASIVANTNIEAAFDLVLKTAVNNNLPQEELPKALVVITDGEFDDMTTYVSSWLDRKERIIDKHNRLIDIMREKFMVAGYTLPKIVFWNVESRNDTYHIVSEYKDTILVSGQSVSTFKNLLSSLNADPYQFMLDTLNDEQYDCVKI